ncbi:ABC transporter permease, partial [Thermocatellispora tengchongensis]|uniref:ABC transporter permease n=1 Tax=Thermocatellispora tengchongensis TaxID=1073253 RepID=UPI003CD06B9B
MNSTQLGRPEVGHPPCAVGGPTEQPSAVRPAPAALPLQRKRGINTQLWRKNRSTILAVLSLAMGAVLWEILGRWVVNPLFLPPLSQVWVRFIELVQAGQLATDIGASSQAYLLGLAVAIAIGGTIGIAMAASKIIRDLLDPWVAILNATP